VSPSKGASSTSPAPWPRQT